ncbi:MAG: hypothetical protein Q9216_003841 [Gyalolechia sp. 2 TL-2023]
MAEYPVRQYQESPPKQSLRFREDRHGYPPQHNFQHPLYQHDLPQGPVATTHPYREPPLRGVEGCSRTGDVTLTIDNPQWSHPYTTRAEDGQMEQTLSRDRHGTNHNEQTRQYGSRKSPSGNSRDQYQEFGWSHPSPERPGRQPRGFPPEDGYNTAGRSTVDYNQVGQPSGANVRHVPQRHHTRDQIYGIDEDNFPQGQMPHNVQSQQRPNCHGENEQGSKFSELPNQPRTAIPAMQNSRNPPKERILISPMSPQIVSWDNPFPTFPSSKTRAKLSREEDLDRSMAEMGFDRSLYVGNSRPVTPAGRISQRTPNGGRIDSQQERSIQTNLRSARNHHPILQTNNGTLHSALGGSRFNQSPVNQPPRQHSSHSPNQLRPQMTYDRHSEDTIRNRQHGAPAAYQAKDQRSRTMPTTFTATFEDLGSQRMYEKDSMVQVDGHELMINNEQKNSGRPTAPQPASTPIHSHSRSTDNPPDGGYVNQEPRTLHTGSHHSQQASMGDVFDSYYHSPHHSDLPFAQEFTYQYAAPREEDLPNFDTCSGPVATHKRGMTIDDHLSSLQPAPAKLPIPNNSQRVCSTKVHPESRPADGASRSKSSPNLQQQYTQESQQYSDGFNFELPGSVPAMYFSSPRPSRDVGDEILHNEGPYRSHRHGLQPKPQVNRHQVSGRDQVPLSRPNTSESYGRLPPSQSPNMRIQPPIPSRIPHEHQSRELGEGPSTVNRAGPRSPPVGAASNPDALPAHPAPVRAGLMQSPPSNQPPRPRPVRQYTNGTSSVQQSSVGPRAQISRAPREETKASAVTYEELEQLRQVSRSNPTDSRTQLLLAKKLVEAASVLADESGRGDQKTSNRNRERFISDAHKLVKRMAQNGYPEAMFYLGDCYSRGLLGLQTDAKEAFAYYQSAARTGHAQAAYRVAVCCEMGLDEGGGTKRDAVKAMQWYQRAATLGDTPAMYKLGVIQLKALLGQPKDVGAALSWLRRAAERADKENPHALHELALLYESSGAEGAGKDEVKARQLFLDAANLGYKFSQFRLGCTFEYGLLGCTIDPRQSITWYSKAAVQDEHQSELALSGWYLTGSEGVLQQSDTEAYLWARKAAQAGLAKAEYAMGYFTEVGIGAPANIEDAKRWYWRSACKDCEPLGTFNGTDPA